MLKKKRFKEKLRILFLFLILNKIDKNIYNILKNRKNSSKKRKPKEVVLDFNKLKWKERQTDHKPI